MSGVLLDTNVLSELLKKHPSAAVLSKLRAIRPDSLFTSVICVMEIRFGAARHPSGTALWQRIERDVLSLVEVLPVGSEEGVRAGEVLAALESAGVRIGVEDVLIAATALERGLRLVTRNDRHLSRVAGLSVENWWA